jgi:hypothetical protein
MLSIEAFWRGAVLELGCKIEFEYKSSEMHHLGNVLSE